MQICYVDDHDQAQGRAARRNRLDISHKGVFLYPPGGTKLLLLESVTKHPSRSTADHISKSISCGRLWDGQLSPAFKSIIFDRGTTQLHVRILGGQGVKKKKPHMFSRKLNKRNFCPTSVYVYMYICIHVYVYIYICVCMYMYICIFIICIFVLLYICIFVYL